MLISQKSQSDCVACCLTMMLHLDYDTVVYGLGEGFTPDGGMMCNEDLLVPFGYKKSRFPGPRSYRYFCFVEGPYPPTTIPLLLLGREALICIRYHFHNPREGHMVYWTGKKILDPGLGKMDPKLYSLDVLSVYLMSRFHRPVGISL